MPWSCSGIKECANGKIVPRQLLTVKYICICMVVKILKVDLLGIFLIYFNAQNKHIFRNYILTTLKSNSFIFLLCRNFYNCSFRIILKMSFNEIEDFINRKKEKS